MLDDCVVFDFNELKLRNPRCLGSRVHHDIGPRPRVDQRMTAAAELLGDDHLYFAEPNDLARPHVTGKVVVARLPNRYPELQWRRRQTKPPATTILSTAFHAERRYMGLHECNGLVNQSCQ